MMLSGVFALLVFLANVKETGSPSEISCDWVCEVHEIHAANVSDQHWKTVLSKTGQMKAIFPLHKRVRKDCAKFTSTENSSSFIEVWISTLASTQPRKLGFLSFAVFNFLEHVLPFRHLFDGKYTERDVDEISTEIYCIFRPTSNESNRLSQANGLDAIITHYFYIRELANVSQNRPFVSHIWTENVYAFSHGFTNPGKKTSTENREYSLQFERLQYIVLSILGYLVWMYLTFYTASFLMLFRTNIGTVEIAKTVITLAIHPEEETESDLNSSPEPTEHGRLEDEIAAQRQPDNHNPYSETTEQGRPEDWLTGAAKRQPNNNFNSSQPTKQVHLEDVWGAAYRNAQPDDVVGSLDDSDDTVPFPEQNPHHSTKLVNRRFSADRIPLLSIQKSQTSDSHSNAQLSGTLESSFTAQKESFVVDMPSSSTLPDSDGTEAGVIPVGDTEQNSATLNVERNDAGGLNHRAHTSSSDNAVSEADTATGQSGAHNRNKKNFKSVRVIHVGGAPSSVGLRSLIASCLLRYRSMKLFFLLFFPLFPVVLLDLFLLPPRLFSRIASSLPSTSMTISVFNFIYKKCPGLLGCMVLYSIRCIFLCFCQSSANRVPSFLFRKHFWCFIINCYITQLLLPNNDFSACDECKEAPSDCPNECEFPVNIKRNGEMLQEIPMKNWKDVFHHLFPKYCQRFFPGDENTTSSCCSLFCFLKTLSRFIFFIFFIILCVLDIALSLPIICVCYGRVWFTVNWPANWCQEYIFHRGLQFICLLIEFLIIFCSIIWAVYLSMCCSMTLEIAFTSLIITCSVQNILGWAIYIIFCHNLMSRYRSFTDKYDNLDLMVLNVCTENHAKKFEQYQKGDGTDIINIPEDLLVSVRNKLIPLKHNVIKLIRSLGWTSIFLIITLIITSSLKQPYAMVLSAAVTLLINLYPWLLDILINLCKKKQLKDAVLKEKVKRHVYAYFEKKLD